MKAKDLITIAGVIDQGLRCQDLVKDGQKFIRHAIASFGIDPNTTDRDDILSYFLTEYMSKCDPLMVYQSAIEASRAKNDLTSMPFAVYGHVIEFPAYLIISCARNALCFADR